MSESVFPEPKTIRADIQALRAIAIAAVVLFHLWPIHLAGGFVGVDVFFVISGFLITTHILNEVSQGTFRISSFWVRRVRRLLPASFLVLVVTAVLIVAFVPVQLWLQWLREVQFSIVYLENWILALDSVDYLALSNEASPAQHFWSLSVEEQFYIVWPVLVALAIWLVGKRDGPSNRKAIFRVLLAVTLGSLAYGIYLTYSEPSIAYFSTPVRAWEFGFGALTAFVSLKASAKVRSILVVLGLALIAFASLTFTTKIAFPGFWALVPVLGTVLVILASANNGFLGKVFSLTPFAWLGEKSYSIYLWHWPLIILVPYIVGTNLTTQLKIVVILMTLGLAALSTKFVEKPFLSGGSIPKFKPVTTFSALAITSVIIVGGVGFAISHANNSIALEKEKADNMITEGIKCYGAAARAPEKEPCTNDDIQGVYPTLESAAADYAQFTNCVNSPRDSSIPEPCEVGDPNSKIKIAMVGDSHAKQYAGALSDLAKKNKWSVEIIGKGRCPFSSARRALKDNVLSEACLGYVTNTSKLIMQKKYDLVLTSQASGVEWMVQSPLNEEETAVKGLIKIWEPITKTGIPVLAIKDNPVPVPKVIRCLEVNELAECSETREKGFKFDPQPMAVQQMANPLVSLVQFDDVFCEAEKCAPIIGHVVVYRDANHITNTFARTIAPYLEKHIVASLAK